MSDLRSWDAAREAFGDAGFCEVAVIAPDALPAALRREVAVDAGDRLVLVGAAGTELWTRLQASRFANRPDPVDDYSAATVGDILERCDLIRDCVVRYPGDGVAPLIPLGDWLGWTTPSPLGLGISATHGLWFAYRALAVVTPITADALPVTLAHPAQSPCLTCADTPCVTQCPVDAVAVDQDFAVRRCVEFRSIAASACAESCLSRLACPVGGASRYPRAQFAYHQRQALDGMQRWLKRDEDA